MLLNLYIQHILYTIAVLHYGASVSFVRSATPSYFGVHGPSLHCVFWTL